MQNQRIRNIITHCILWEIHVLQSFKFQIPRGKVMDDIKRSFHEDGYFVVRGLFSENRCRRWAQAIDKNLHVRGSEPRFYPGGPNVFSDFWDMIVDPDLQEVLREVLDADPRYLLIGDLHANHNAHHWHRDYALRGETDMPVAMDDDRRFAVVKLAVYVDPGCSALGLVPGSQRASIKQFFGKDIYDDEFLNSPDGIELAKRAGVPAPILNVASVGDVIGFDPRIYHAGSFVDPDSAMPSRDHNEQKKNIFISYGSDDFWSQMYFYYYRNFRKDLLYGEIDREFENILKSNDMFPQFEEYGQNSHERWLQDNLISPPCFADNYADGEPIGSVKWYETLGDGFRDAGHSFAASRAYDSAIQIGGGGAANLKLKMLRRLYTKIAESRDAIGDEAGSGQAAREAIQARPNGLGAWFKDFLSLT
ncbi:phytanoyl-CoA dioxygenase family protein [Rhodospirillales bacterium]|nr:phytanoyl-CoA dioxygenase family protein [Rhodospirillales bacterium]